MSKCCCTKCPCRYENQCLDCANGYHVTKRTCEIQNHPTDTDQAKLVVDGCPLLYVTRKHAEEFKRNFDASMKEKSHEKE